MLYLRAASKSIHRLNDFGMTIPEVFGRSGYISLYTLSIARSYVTLFHTNSTENLAHNYATVYDDVIGPYRHNKINLLEIGLWCPYFPGSSVRAWSRYLTKGTYYGVDIVDCTHLSNKNTKISILNQKNEEQLDDYIKDKPKFDFIIDDGCHEEDAITISLGALFPQLKSGGVYFIEDLHVVDKTRLFDLVTKEFTSSFINKEK